MRFRATLELGGKTATGIRVPAEIVASLGSSKRPPVRVTIKGYTYRSTVAVMGGAFMPGVSAEVGEKAGVVSGSAVTLTPDGSSERLSYSMKHRFVISIERAKTAETRQRRIDKSVDTLREGRTWPEASGSAARVELVLHQGCQELLHGQVALLDMGGHRGGDADRDVRERRHLPTR